MTRRRGALAQAYGGGDADPIAAAAPAAIAVVEHEPAAAADVSAISTSDESMSAPSHLPEHGGDTGLSTSGSPPSAGAEPSPAAEGGLPQHQEADTVAAASAAVAADWPCGINREQLQPRVSTPPSSSAAVSAARLSQSELENRGKHAGSRDASSDESDVLAPAVTSAHSHTPAVKATAGGSVWTPPVFRSALRAVTEPEAASSMQNSTGASAIAGSPLGDSTVVPLPPAAPGTAGPAAQADSCDEQAATAAAAAMALFCGTHPQATAEGKSLKQGLRSAAPSRPALEAPPASFPFDTRLTWARARAGVTPAQATEAVLAHALKAGALLLPPPLVRGDAGQGRLSVKLGVAFPSPAADPVSWVVRLYDEAAAEQSEDGSSSSAYRIIVDVTRKRGDILASSASFGLLASTLRELRPLARADDYCSDRKQPDPAADVGCNTNSDGEPSFEGTGAASSAGAAPLLEAAVGDTPSDGLPEAHPEASAWLSIDLDFGRAVYASDGLRLL